jgi:hypothetical protein
MRFARYFLALLFVWNFALVAFVAQPASAAAPNVTPLLAKNWAVGYALFGLCVLLGVLAVTVTSKRKTIRKRD